MVVEVRLEMRARLRYLARSPRTPQRLAHYAVEAGLILAGLLAVVLAVSGIPSHALAAGLEHVAQAAGTIR